MAEADSLYKQVFGVRLQVPCDMPDDVLAFCVQLAKAELAKVHDWQAEGDATVASCKAALDKSSTTSTDVPFDAPVCVAIAPVRQRVM